MNSSFEDQASQSTTTDQQSEASSVNPRTLRTSYNPNTNNDPNHQVNTQNIVHQNSNRSEVHLVPDPSGGGYSRRSSVQNSQLKPPREAGPAVAAAAQNSTINNGNNYTGVDKLIIASMLDDTVFRAAAAAASGSTGYMPSGRGIAYQTGYDYVHQIPVPRTRSELELFRLLDRANLLSYFGTFLNFGGDDVQQLSDADEEEFLEIMGLVGMTQKPLHVRRLQRALIEWRENKEAELYDFRRQALQNVGLGSNGPISGSIHQGRNLSTLSSNPLLHSTPALTATSDSSIYGQQQESTIQHNSAIANRLVGAPKRIRLMDNLHKRTTPTTDTGNQNSDKADTVHCTQQTTNATRFTTTQSLSPTDNKSIDQLPPSPSSELSDDDRDDDDDDVSIEVMNSPQSPPYSPSSPRNSQPSPNSNQGLPSSALHNSDSNLGLGSGEGRGGAPKVGSESSNSTNFSHNKYGRYKASLQGSQATKRP